MNTGLGSPSAYVHYAGSGRREATHGAPQEQTGTYLEYLAFCKTKNWFLRKASAPYELPAKGLSGDGGAEEEECQNQYFPAPPVLGFSPCTEEYSGKVDP
jgi:hypothetical protein